MGSLTLSLVGVLAVAGCHTRTEGAQVDIRVVHEPSRGEIEIDAVEIVECTGSIARHEPTRPGRWWIATAHAHTSDTPTRLGRHLLIDLSSQGPVAYGRLHPPPGLYCEVEVRFHVEGADVLAQAPLETPLDVETGKTATLTVRLASDGWTGLWGPSLRDAVRAGVTVEGS